jgi:hypothetical protein
VTDRLAKLSREFDREISGEQRTEKTKEQQLLAEQNFDHLGD